ALVAREAGRWRGGQRRGDAWRGRPWRGRKGHRGLRNGRRDVMRLLLRLGWLLLLRLRSGRLGGGRRLNPALQFLFAQRVHGLAVDARRSSRRGGRGGSEIRELLLVMFLHQRDDVFVVRLMKEDVRPIEQEPGHRKPDDDGDIDRFAEAGAGALVVDGIEQMDQLMRFKVGIAAGTNRLWPRVPVFGYIFAGFGLDLGVAKIRVARRSGWKLQDRHGGSEDRTHAGAK